MARRDRRLRHYVLSPANGFLTGLTCVSIMEGMSGRLPASYAKLNGIITRTFSSAAPPPDEKELGTQRARGDGGTAGRQSSTAEQIFPRRRSPKNPKDYYTIAAFTDLMLTRTSAELRPFRC